VLALERLAERDGKSVDAVLAAEMRDFVSAESDFLRKSIRGLATAFR
jgi:hypothetical protein